MKMGILEALISYNFLLFRTPYKSLTTSVSAAPLIGNSLNSGTANLIRQGLVKTVLLLVELNLSPLDRSLSLWTNHTTSFPS